jgi:hypothetical protein
MDEAARIRAEAKKCRDLARQAGDPMTAANLRALADDYDAEARRLLADDAPIPSIPTNRPE